MNDSNPNPNLCITDNSPCGKHMDTCDCASKMKVVYYVGEKTFDSWEGAVKYVKQVKKRKHYD